MRERLYLNHGWRYVPDYKPEYLKNEFSDATFKLVDVPHQINEIPYCVPDAGVYQHVACYRKMFILPSTMDNKRILLHFDGVMSCAAVFVNGKKVIANKGGYTPFECDVTSLIQNGDNLVAVVVDASAQEDTPPYGGELPFLTGGGIYRSVWVEAAEQVYISKLTARTLKTDNGWKIAVNALAQGGNAADFKLYLFDGEEKIASQYCSAADNKLSFEWDIPVAVTEWSCENPKTYRLGVSLSNGDVIDRCIGFRTVRAKSDGIYINEKKVRLNGINRYQSYPYVVCAMPASMQKYDAQLIKETGFNAVRCADGAASPDFLDECDRLGILVLEEVPVYGHTGNEQWQENLLFAAQSMMLRDICHPSVILWGLGDDSSLASVLNKGFHKLDPSRPTYSACSVFSSEICDIPAIECDDAAELHSPFGRSTSYLITSCKDGFSQAFDSDLTAGRFIESFADHNIRTGFDKCDGIDHSGIFDMFRNPKDKAYEIRALLSKEPFIHVYFEDGCAAVCTNCDGVRVKRDDKIVGDYKNTKDHVLMIDDLCGDLLVSEEKLDVKRADAVKKLLYLSAREFRQFTYDAKRTSVYEKKLSLDVPTLAILYDKYNYHSLDRTYTFEGICDGKSVCKCVKGAIAKVTLKTELVNKAPIHADTFDVTMVKVTAVDENDNRVFGCTDSVTVEFDGSIDIIGPRTFSLINGARSFFVRTKGGRGEAQLRINTESIGKKTIYIDVERMSQREINHARPHIN